MVLITNLKKLTKMQNFIKSFKTELIKKKRSGIFTLSIVLGLLIPVIVAIVNITRSLFFDDNDLISDTTPLNYYFNNLENFIIPYASFFLPLLIIICASKVAQIDHKNNSWNLMETQPVKKISIYFSKFALLLYANLISILCFLTGTVLFGWLTTLFITPEAHFILEIPFLLIFKLGLRVFTASIAMTAIQYVISVLIRSFIWPIMIGFILLLLPQIVTALNLDFFWFPYKYLPLAGSNPLGSDFNYLFIYNDYLSILFAIVFLFFGYNYYKLKTLKLTFWSPKSKLIKALGVITFFSFGLYFLLTPKQLEKHNKTVLTGKISSDKWVQNVYVFDKIVGDTIAKMPVIDNSFSYHFKENIPNDFYFLIFDNYSRHEMYFGKNDSIFIDYKNYGRKNEAKFKGTRIAEHIQKERKFNYNFINFYLENNSKLDDAEFYMDGIYENWQEELQKLSSTRTVDNIIPQNDFIERNKKQIALKNLLSWNEFKKKRKALFPNKDYVVNEKIKSLENSIRLNDESMLTDSNYLNFIKENLIKNDLREINQDQKYFEAISKLDEGVMKNKLLYSHLAKNIKEIEEITKRDSVFNKYINQISNTSYVALLEKNRSELNRLSKGVISPTIYAYDRNKKTTDFNDFKGNYVVIDVWASWCAPCKAEAPYFEKAALALKDKPVKFISLDVDNKEDDWLVDIKNKSDTSLNLRAKNPAAFMKKFNINGIPRFILLNPEGIIEDANFMRPSNKKFEEVLKSYL